MNREQRIEIRKILLSIKDKFPDVDEKELYDCIEEEVKLINNK